MKKMSTSLITFVILGALAVPCLAGGPILDTRVTLVVGFPGSGDDASSVLVVPGTVIPVSQTGRSQVNVDDEGAEQAQAIQDLADKLRRAIGLDSVEVAYSEVYSLEVEASRGVTGPRAASTIRGELTLLDFNEDLAVYRVVFRRGAELLADSKVAVERGGRAVVGGLDGEDAPYFFLVLQPAARALFVKGDVSQPRKIETVPAVYTEEARVKRTQGLVILQALINTDGEVEEVEVLRGMPDGLTEAAIEALKKWTFEPATLDGEAVDVFYNLTFNFRLSPGKEEEG